MARLLLLVTDSPVADASVSDTGSRTKFLAHGRDLLMGFHSGTVHRICMDIVYLFSSEIARLSSLTFSTIHHLIFCIIRRSFWPYVHSCFILRFFWLSIVDKLCYTVVSRILYAPPFDMIHLLCLSLCCRKAVGPQFKRRYPSDGSIQ